ncbi:MAG TPA: DUF4232 domain-containing protein [Candidatus Dormibacteraeota bacterium]|nr:DUF4232 domain-containing protein [Candidatus Dormibacteraeota bacterium]
MGGTSLVMAAVGVMALGAACEGLGYVSARPPARVQHPSASASPEPSPQPNASAPGAAPTPTAAPAAAGPDRCHTGQLQVGFVTSQGAAGHIFLTFRMTDAGQATCWMYGFVGMQMLDASGRSLPTRVLRNGGAFAGQAGPTRFDVPPGRSATFDVAYGDVQVGNETTCPEAARLIVTPPDEFDHVTIPVSGFRLAPCNSGELDVTPVRPPT